MAFKLSDLSEAAEMVTENHFKAAFSEDDGFEEGEGEELFETFENMGRDWVNLFNSIKESPEKVEMLENIITGLHLEKKGLA